MDRTYSTREVAQMWNVSESTVKRWADTAGLECQRTPGGHRRFSLENIRGFQQERGFEATGLLTTERWEDPSVEDLLNRKDFVRVREQVSFLAAHNQRSQIEELLKRLYLRGMSLDHLYDYIVMPVARSTQAGLSDRVLSGGQAKLIQVNLEEAVSYLFPHIIRKRHNQRVSLCASPDRAQYLPVNAAARILEVEGWEVLNLGWSVPYPAMATMVEEEPINLVCIVSNGSTPEESTPELDLLLEAVHEYRLPLVSLGRALPLDGDLEGSIDGFYFSDFSAFRDFIGANTRTG
jgi:excisionase family DNA binding protein